MPSLDLGYLALFLGLRVNQVVTERMRAAGFEKVRESHGHVIQHLIKGERSITELAARMEVTQQAVSKAVAELLKLEILETVADVDRRTRRVRLSRRGWKAVRQARQIRSNLEKRLIRAAGDKKYETARSILTACLKALGGIDRVRTRRIIPLE